MRQSSRKVPSIREVARKYVDEQIELLKKHGTPVCLSKTVCNSMVNQLVRLSVKQCINV